MPTAFETTISFSRAKRVGHHIAISGTAPLDAAGNTVGVGSCYAQTRRCLEIVVGAARDAGAAGGLITRTRIMLVDVERDWREAARAHAEVFGGIPNPPACTIVQIGRFIDPA